MTTDKQERDIIYFELNNWTCGKDYPNAEPFLSWMGTGLNLKFRDKNWVKENELCVVASLWDMSSNFCITAKREWVEQNCPSLLDEFKEFQRFPQEDADTVYGQFDCPFVEWSEENIGLYISPEEEDSEGFLYFATPVRWEEYLPSDDSDSPDTAE